MTTAGTWRVSTTVLCGVALILTVLRMLYRTSKRCIWIDDIFAGIAAGSALAGLSAYWIYEYTDVEGVVSLPEAQTSKIRAYWVDMIMFISVVWTTRISSVFTLIRFLPHRLRLIPYFIAALFFTMASAQLTQKIILCHRDTEWEVSSNPQCSGRTTLVTELCFELVSNVIMILAPSRALSLLEPSSLHRRSMMFVLFFVGVLITAGSVGHAVFLVQNTGSLERFTGDIQAYSSLILINLPPLGTWICLILNRNYEDPDLAFAPQSGSTKHNQASARKLTISLPIVLRSANNSPQSSPLRRSSFFSNEKSLHSLDLHSQELSSPHLGTPTSKTTSNTFSALVSRSDEKIGDDTLSSLDAENVHTVHYQSSSSALTDQVHSVPNKPPSTVHRPYTSQNNAGEPQSKYVRWHSPVIADIYSLRSHQTESIYSSIYSNYFADEGPNEQFRAADHPSLINTATPIRSPPVHPGPPPASHNPQPF